MGRRFSHPCSAIAKKLKAKSKKLKVSWNFTYSLKAFYLNAYATDYESHFHEQGEQPDIYRFIKSMDKT